MSAPRPCGPRKNTVQIRVACRGGVSYIEFANVDDDLNVLKDPDDPLYCVLSAMRRILVDLADRVADVEERVGNAGI